MYNILICDDEKDIVSALKIYIEAEGYRAWTAYTGKQALEVVRKQEIHLVLLDIMMPEMDGISTMVKLRESTGNIPVILLTAKSEDTDKILGLNIGADDYMGKSVSVDGEKIYLTPREYDILKLLMEHAGQVFSPKEIYRKIWGEDPFGAENTIAVHIRHLREKLETNPAEPRYLKVVWGQGYKIEKEQN